MTLKASTRSTRSSYWTRAGRSSAELTRSCSARLASTGSLAITFGSKPRRPFQVGAVGGFAEHGSGADHLHRIADPAGVAEPLDYVLRKPAEVQTPALVSQHVCV